MRVIVNLSIPAINHKCDISLPTTISVYDAVKMIGKAAMELTNGEYSRTDEEMLCLEGYSQPLDYSKTIDFYNIKNGDALYFI